MAKRLHLEGQLLAWGGAPWSAGLGGDAGARLAGRGQGHGQTAVSSSTGRPAVALGPCVCRPSPPWSLRILKARPYVSEPGKLNLRVPKNSVIRNFQKSLEPFFFFLAAWQSHSNWIAYFPTICFFF